MTLRTRLYLSFSGMVLLLALVGGMSYVSMKNMDTQDNQLAGTAGSLSNVLRAQVNQLRFIIDGDPIYLENSKKM